MATTMSLIAKQTIGSAGAGSVTFTDIPTTYKDLRIIISARLNNTQYGQTIRIKPNGSSSNGTARILRGYGSSNSSYTYANVLATNNDLGNGATASVFTSIDVYIHDYRSTNYKAFAAESVSENNATDGRQEIAASLWSTNDQITSLVFDNDGGYSFMEGSTFYLYGVSNSAVQNTLSQYALGGDVIVNDGSYWYHAFKYSGSFTPLKNLTADVLVVAGGGGGSQGGGGAGGLRLLSSQVLTSSTNYTCAVGGGGNGSVNNNSNGSSGTNSSFAGSGLTTISATGGGYGAMYYQNGGAGGSGGGAGGNNQNPNCYGGAGNAGGYTPAEGNNGGDAQGINNNQVSGGGGGAGASGQSAQSGSQSGNGGAGASSATLNVFGAATTTGQLSSGNYYYAGGGGGGHGVNSGVGSGGVGGGGTGGNQSAAGTAGTANTGGGGGGDNNFVISQYGKPGGSGIIIVRYAI